MALQLVINVIKAFYLAGGRECYAGISAMPKAEDPGLG